MIDDIEHIHAVGAAIINDDRRVLIAKRPIHKSMPNKWEFPGGKIEPNETPQECIIREIKEELGIVIVTETYIGLETFNYEDMIVSLHLFVCRIPYEQEITLHEHQAIAWIAFEDFKLYDMPVVDLPFVEKLKTIL